MGNEIFQLKLFRKKVELHSFALRTRVTRSAGALGRRTNSRLRPYQPSFHHCFGVRCPQKELLVCHCRPYYFSSSALVWRCTCQRRPYQVASRTTCIVLFGLGPIASIFKSNSQLFVLLGLLFPFHLGEYRVPAIDNYRELERYFIRIVELFKLSWSGQCVQCFSVQCFTECFEVDTNCCRGDSGASECFHCLSVSKFFYCFINDGPGVAFYQCNFNEQI